MTAATHPRVALISGPLEVSHEYFKHYYEPRITKAIAADDHFVVGPVSGIDALALDHLLDTAHVPPSRISVHMAGFEALSRPVFVKKLESRGVQVVNVSEATTTWDRDAAMTRASDYDILRYRTEWEQQAIYGHRWRARGSRFAAGNLSGEEEV
ncbi:hypothetical protein LTR78_000337 [Recurvomyces mirabilis]|uniref:Uncharacterized protein n=1 Tax=Recurvomyces mirabilis TaxID=574656 RepID=A0AAE0WYA2_9PEZI|nr:hypothetical protein LTR78_000337 [Recurvomyces mirabilis]KAK5161992.1 hypothetical protein LTS14_000338 [Recurvomyces mirabilis]